MIGFLAALVLAPQDPPDWRGDPALAKPISVRSEGEPVRTMVARIGEQSGVPLIALPEVGEQRVIAITFGAPARDVMERLAKQFNATWRKAAAAPGYELYQTPLQVQKDVSEFRDALLKPLRQWRKAASDRPSGSRGTWESAAKQMADLIGEEIVHLGKYDEEYNGDDPLKKKAWSDRRREIEARMNALRSSHSPVLRIINETVGKLTDQQLLELHYEPYVVYSTHPTPRQQVFPAQASIWASELVNDYLEFCGGSPTLSKNQEEIREKFGYPNLVHGLTRADVKGVRLKIKADQNRKPLGSPPHGYQVDILLNREPWVASVSESVHLDTPRGAPKPVSPSTGDLSMPFVPTARHLELQAKRDQLGVDSFYGFWEAGKTHYPFQYIAQVLNEIATSLSINLISDCPDGFAGGFYDLPENPKGYDALKTWGDMAHSWTFEGGWVSFTWASDDLFRSRTAPSDKLVQARDLAAAAENFDDRAEAISLVGPFFNNIRLNMDPSELNDVARFWAAIGSQTREQMRSGKPILGEQLPTEALDHLYRALMQIENSYSSNAPSILQGPRDTPEKQWLMSLGLQFYDRHRSRGFDQEVTQILPQGIPSSARLHFKSFPQDGLATEWMGLPLHNYPLSQFRNEKPKEGILWTTTGERCFFVVELSNAWAFEIDLSTFRRPTSKGYGSYDELPADVRQKIGNKARGSGA